MKITHKIEGKIFKIYIDGILHLSVPGGSSVHSYIEQLYCIDIHYGKTCIVLEYNTQMKWKKILELLDKFL